MNYYLNRGKHFSNICLKISTFDLYIEIYNFIYIDFKKGKSAHATYWTTAGILIDSVATKPAKSYRYDREGAKKNGTICNVEVQEKIKCRRYVTTPRMEKST